MLRLNFRADEIRRTRIGVGLAEAGWIKPLHDVIWVWAVWDQTFLHIGTGSFCGNYPKTDPPTTERRARLISLELCVHWLNQCFFFRKRWRILPCINLRLWARNSQTVSLVEAWMETPNILWSTPPQIASQPGTTWISEKLPESSTSAFSTDTANVSSQIVSRSGTH